VSSSSRHEWSHVHVISSRSEESVKSCHKMTCQRALFPGFSFFAFRFSDHGDVSYRQATHSDFYSSSLLLSFGSLDHLFPRSLSEMKLSLVVCCLFVVNFSQQAMAILISPRTGTFGQVSPAKQFKSKTHRLYASDASTIETNPSDSPAAEGGIVPTDALICGGGPAGLLCAIMLAQKFPQHKIKVYDRLPEPLSPTDETVWNDVAKFYLIGLGSRGQISLEKFGVWKAVTDVCTAVVGRKDWAPGSKEGFERIFEGRKYNTQVLPRDKLVAVLHKHIVDNYSQQIELNYEYLVRPIDFGKEGSDSVLVEVSKCQGDKETDLECKVEAVARVSASLMIAADGTQRTIANQMEQDDSEKRKAMNPLERLFAGKPFQVTRYEDDNKRVYKTIALKVPAGWRPDLNYSARSEGGRMNIDALPANRNGDYCGVLLLREDDEMAQPDVNPLKFRQFLDELLPQFSKIIDDETAAQVAKKGPSFLPAFRYVSPRLNQGDRTIVLGDCAHTVKPYFGLGANSALEDVKVLADVIDSTDTLTEAVHEFSKRRANEAKSLVRISRDLDRPGKLGTVTFLIPIILDSIFSKLAPKIFAPNVISMLQRDDLTFEQVGARKRRDRILQLVIISVGLASVAGATKFLVRSLASVLGRRGTTVAAGLVASGIALAFGRKVLPFLVPGMAPADVLAKTKSSITKKDAISLVEKDK
jgi:kynurenine 3-monooxygenase